MTREFDWFKRTFGFKAEKDFDVENSIEKDLDKELDWVKNARERGEKKYKTLKDKDAFDEIKGFSYAVGTRINVDAPKPDWSKRFPNTPAFYSIDPAEYPTKPFSFNIDQSEYANSPIGGIEKEIRREITKEVKDAVKRGGDIKYGKPFEVGDVVRMTKEELDDVSQLNVDKYKGRPSLKRTENRISGIKTNDPAINLSIVEKMREHSHVFDEEEQEFVRLLISFFSLSRNLIPLPWRTD